VSAPTPTPTRAPRPEAVLVGVTVLWGSTFIVAKDVVRSAPPLAYLTVRFGVAAALLALLYRRQALRLLLARGALVDGAVLGLLHALGLALQTVGSLYTTASKTAFITALNTPLVPVVAFLLYRSRPSPPQRIAVVLATVGLGLLTYPPGSAEWNPGDLATVGCAVVYAFTIVEIARRSVGREAGPFTALQVSVAALVFALLWSAAHLALALVPAAALPELVRLETRPFLIASGGRFPLELAYMSIVCTAVAMATQTWAMARMSATHAAIVFALEPVFATALAVAVEGGAEWPGARGGAGAALVLAAVLVSELRIRDRLRS
jgi:drug/metabolite transporter (DMT)-like permease